MKLTKYISTIFFIGSLIVLPLATHAELIDENFGSTFGLGTSDLESTVVKIIQWVLGLLGLIAVIMILYGGFIWMTAGGNEERVETAKKIITAAVVGLVVVLLAWAIVIFVIRTGENVAGIET